MIPTPPPVPDGEQGASSNRHFVDFWTWAEAARWGDNDSNADYFRFPFAILYVADQVVNLFMSLYMLLFLHAANKTCFHFWVGLWMLSIFGVLWFIINKLVHTKIYMFSAIFHNISELMVGLYSVDAFNLTEGDKTMLLIFTFVLVGQTHLILHRSINVQVTLTIVIGDCMHYVAIALLILGATTNESPHYWWLVAAMGAHHAYDAMVYLSVMMPSFVVKQYWACVLNTLAILLAFICCISTCEDNPNAPFMVDWS